jgi:hypothetical protein
LSVPAGELLQVAPRDLLHRPEKVVDRRCFPVVAGEIKGDAGVKKLRTEEGAVHADDFRSLAVDRRCVKIVDLFV